MTVLLRAPGHLPPPNEYDYWLRTTGVTVKLDPDRRLPDLEHQLERAYDDCESICWKIGLRLARHPSSAIARTPTLGAYGTDFRLMMAWVELVRQLARRSERILVVVEDPWLYRQMENDVGLDSGPQPAIWLRSVSAKLRGFASRSLVALRTSLAAAIMRGKRHTADRDGRAILVYGHPQSDAKGNDAYFGDLLLRFPFLYRVLHTDCGLHRARRLCAGGRTVSLCAWGNALFALGAVTATWRLPNSILDGRWGWLIRRAVVVENSGGGPAMNRWQIHCQDRWLKAAKPTLVLWPWENFAWERVFCRAARQNNTRTIGYQHTVVGRHQINFAPTTNPDGEASLPDRIFCNGPAYMEELKKWGIGRDKLVDAGAFHVPRLARKGYDPAGPVFIPLSASHAIAAQQLRAAEILAVHGWNILVKDHPMYPFLFEESDRIKRTSVSLDEQESLSAVLFCTGTVGLQGLMKGIPTYRLLLDDDISVSILPSGVSAIDVTFSTLVDRVSSRTPLPDVRWEDLFSPIDESVWLNELGQSHEQPGNKERDTASGVAAIHNTHLTANRSLNS